MILSFHLIIMLSVCCHFVQASYLMETVAGSGSISASGDGGPATSAGISNFYGMWTDSLGNLFLPDPSNNQLRKVDTSGNISAFIGSGTQSNAGVGGSALSVNLDGVGSPYGDTAGNLYLTSFNLFIWFYNHTSGYVSRFVGAPGGGYSGDGGPATSAKLSYPLGAFLSTNGILYFADFGNSVIRAVNIKTNIITAFAGSLSATSLGDGGPATSAAMSPFSVWGNTVGVFYIGDSGNNRIRKVATDGIITTVAGTGSSSYNGDNIPATSADLNNPYNCQGDTLGNLYIADNNNYRIRMVSVTTGNITTIAGNGQSTPANASVHVATAVGLNPSMIQLDSSGNIYFGDGGYIRKMFAATASPTSAPSFVSSANPTESPSIVPSANPTTAIPSVVPSANPITAIPSVVPSAIPITAIPSVVPSAIPTTAIPSVVPSAIPSTAIPSVVPSAIPSEIPSFVPSTHRSAVPTMSPSVVPSFRPSVVNVTLESSSRSQRLSDLHIFYATFFPAFFVVFCVVLIGYYLWMHNKGE